MAFLWQLLKITGAVFALVMIALTVATIIAYLFGPRVIRSLTNKYLFKRRIAWVSLIAVMLCTTMVLVVISVMGGWLRMFREQFHGLNGDISITSRSLTGFGQYEEMIRRIEALPDVEAAAPVIRTFGLMKINRGSPDAVQVMGYPMERIIRVNNFGESLYRQHELPQSEGQQPATRPSFGLIPEIPYEDILPKARNVRDRPGMIVGAGVVGISKNEQGVIERPSGLYHAFVRLEVMGLSGDEVSLEGARPTPNFYWIVDDSRTQIWQYDSKTVYVPFDVLQKDLGMGEVVRTNPDTNEKLISPARTTDIHIKAKPGVNLYALKPKIQEIVAEVQPDELARFDPRIIVQTWEEANATWLGAVEKEKMLVTMLFGMISIVAIFLIFCIFYMIVVEKTKDIGIIKSVGATSQGVAGIFLGYGLAIGIVGSMLGLLLSYLIVHNINWLHDQLHARFGVHMWNPEVYAFDTIPNTMNPVEIYWIVGIAIIASVLGALVPAVRAARMNPVEALRWE